MVFEEQEHGLMRGMVEGGDFRMVTVAAVMTTMASDGSQPQTCSWCPAFAITRSFP